MGAFDCFRKSVTFQRNVTGAYVEGHPVKDSSPTDVTILASVQPLSGKEMKELPEGRRTDQIYKLYTSTKLRTVGGQNPDKVIIEGNEFEVIEVSPYQSDIIDHYKVIIAKVNTNADI